nr:integrin beta 1B [Halisarca dujardinii]
MDCLGLFAGQACTTFTDCTSCIQSTLFCKWCANANITGRCISDSLTFSPPCSDTQRPGGNVMLVEDRILSDTVQVRPQSVQLLVRPGEPQTFQVTIRPAPTFPLDVYFLMDFSASMEDDLATLQSIAGDIARDIGTITPNYQLGFGSFVDKPTAPYIDTREAVIDHPCGADEICDAPYSYHHHLNLTSDGSAFSNAVSNLLISGNLDSPEGGIDGLLQAVVCDDIIGWRPNPARRLLVYITDASFHFGADGKIGGAMTPHDGKCHLRKIAGQNFYDYEEALRLDYPSISMLNTMMLDRGISPIFLVTSSEQSLYRNLGSVFDNAVVGFLTRDSANLVGSLRQAYNELSSRVRLFIDSIPGLTVTPTSSCLPNAIPDGQGGCTRVTIGETITIDVKVEVTQCTPEIIQGRTLNIRTSIFGDITVEIRGVCECPCRGTQMENSTQCSGQGSLVCGLCECNPGRLGDRCECADGGLNPTLVCKNGPNMLPCSGPNAGDCVCGQCICRTGINNNPEFMYSGEMCQCNNFQCGVDTRGRLCSGFGECTCNGVCVCEPGYSDDICQCRPEEECRAAPSDMEFCSGQGTCNCGDCTCNEGYGGTHCATCTDANICGPEQCQRYDACTSCLFYINNRQVLDRGLSECSACDQLNVTMAFRDVVDETDSRVGNSTFTCVSSAVEGECNGVVYFIRVGSGGESTVLARNTPSRCSTAIPAWIIAVPIVIGLLILGIITIVIAKLLLLLVDRYEYKQFKKEVAGSKFGASVNPIYNSANQEFQNPAYGGV